MERLKIEYFADPYDDLEKSKDEIIKILNDLGLENSFLTEITTTPSLNVYVYSYEKTDKSYSSDYDWHLHLRKGRFYIIGYGLFYFEIRKNNNVDEIYTDGYISAYKAISSHYFHFIRDFREKIFNYLEECYKEGVINLKELTKHVLKNYKVFVEEERKVLDEVKKILEGNKEIVKKRIVEKLEKTRDLYVQLKVKNYLWIIDINSHKKVFILTYSPRYVNADKEHKTLS